MHTPAFIDATRRAGHGEDGDWRRFGYGPGDNPIFADMHEAAALVCGATVAAAREVVEGRALHAFNAAGGLHHAMAGHASGFCVYDDPAVGIAWMLGHGVERIAYVDVDVHHGDGVQAAFAPTRACSPSRSTSTRPRSASSPERVGVRARVRRRRGLGAERPDAARHRRRRVARRLPAALCPPSAPSVPTSSSRSSGATRTTPIRSRTCGSRRAPIARPREMLHALAHEAATGRWVATGGGGYQWASVVPRAWTMSFAEMAATPVPDELPTAWVERASALAGRPVPATLSEPAL